MSWRRRRRLLPEGTEPPGLRPLGQQAFRNGVTSTRYAVLQA